MNKLTLREAVGRVLLGVSAATAGSVFQPAAVAQDQGRRSLPAIRPRWRK